MGGVGFQQFFVLVFLYIAFRFQQQVKRENPPRLAQAFLLLYAQYAVLILITIRIIFRLIEYAQGLDSSIPNHEAYQYIFDTVPMLIALVVYNAVHPGRIMPGKEGDFPSRRERKNYFKGDGLGSSSLPLVQTQGFVSMPEEITFQPKTPDAVPSHGYVR
ncbi:MAG: hypothetical protein L6R39_003031 [Caloplaca ligustica]|nr:MAG: hypothetical protein L6R39_003031 [Caloplaca ligustica]